MIFSCILVLDSECHFSPVECRMTKPQVIIATDKNEKNHNTGT